MTPSPIYLDYNATTPVDDRVLQAMLPYFSGKFGNASSSTHSFGWNAKQAVDNAREQLAMLINCEPNEIIFTSGATEAINLAIKGVAEVYSSKGKHIITCATEHKAVLDCCASLEKKGFEITYLPVDENGLIDLAQLKIAIKDTTILVSIMTANNETGVIQPVKEIADMAHERGVIFMSDATQAIGKFTSDVQQLGIDLMPLSAHKFYGPKGVGALFIRRKKPRVTLTPLIEGGGHEKGLRSGTYNVPGIVGMGTAASLVMQSLVKDIENMFVLRSQLEQQMLTLGNTFVNGKNAIRLPNTTNICFRDIHSNDIIKPLANALAVATGSACTSALPQPSHVLMAMGLSETEAYSSVRFSIGRFTTEKEIDEAVKLIREIVKK